MSEIFLVEFKGSGREHYINLDKLVLKPDDFVIVQAEKGEDLGRIVRKTELCRGKQIETVAEAELFNILRKATEVELEKLEQNRAKEKEALKECQRMADTRNLGMKLVDVEYQFDGNRLTFFFTADKRVDFRELVRELASIYRTRIELRQIGARDEARRVGGYGRCGLPQCCSAFLKDFVPLSPNMARVQSMSLTPSKITGNCGRLLCCLLYELETYESSLPQYPRLGSKYENHKSEGLVDKVDIFKEYIVVRYPEGETEIITLQDLKRQEKKKTKPSF